MKKFLIGLLSAGMVTASCAGTVFAAGINSAEQRILDQLDAPYTIGSITVSIDQTYRNTAENFFLANDISEAQADTVLAELDIMKEILSRNAQYLVKDGDFYFEGLTDMPKDDQDALFASAQRALKALGFKLAVDDQNISVTDANGKELFSAGEVIKSTGLSETQASSHAWMLYTGIAGVLLLAGGVCLIAKKRAASHS
ncbi:hypothetical protein [Candidatus Soleaferrea massiliensis]|uniref:hypothetical protein n=1 Tax=Candidatus Soleaferrea massiliensis TaxID=1470354 RepID=UPI00058E03C9|nr:hypothetical protein [Candidatus Soleaferrea massiliensis]